MAMAMAATASEVEDAWLLDLEPLDLLDEGLGLAPGDLADHDGVSTLDAGSGSSRGTSGDAAGEGGAAEAEPKETDAERRERNREACRRHRSRKRREANEMRDRNDELEKSRDLYLGRIAALQAEVEALRYGGAVDLAKENELLRVEIKRHKAFVRRVVDVVGHGMPEPLSEEERFGLLRNGIEAAKCQVMGHAFASASDPSWVECPIKEIAGRPISLKMQYLPLGSSPEEAKRLNVRFDFLDMPASCHDIARAWSVYMSDESLQQQVKQRFANGVEQTMEDILPESMQEVANKMAEGEKIRLVRYRVSRDKADAIGPKQYELIGMIGEGVKSSVPFAALFGADSPQVEGLAPGYLCDAHIASVSNFAGLMERTGITPPEDEDFHRYETPFSKGLLAVPVPGREGLDPRCHCCTISSLPLNNTAGSGQGCDFDKNPFAFGPDGKPHPEVLAQWELGVGKFYAMLEIISGTAKASAKAQEAADDATPTASDELEVG